MVRTSSREIIDLVISLIVLTIAFSYPRMDFKTLTIVAVGVGTGFILHELAHKFTAQKYGYAANYEASPFGLLLALGLSFMTGGFVFAAPGAVMITESHYYNSLKSRKELAYISVSGVVMNLILAVSFYVVSFYVIPGSLANIIVMKGASINVILAGFNMIPFGPLDGAKVWRNNPVLWIIMAILSIILFLVLVL